jgi:protein-ribulosamine 3-kinase
MMQEKIKNKIESAISDKIISQKSILGGCMNDSVIFSTKSGKSFFIKTNNNFTNDMFLCESNGLNELSKAKVIRVPEVIYVSEDFLILENILQNTKSKTFWEDFGRAFAMLHKYSNKTFGFYEDNYIGSTPQLNVTSESESTNWTEFYFNQRLLVQFQLAEQKGYAGTQLRDAFLRLENKLDSILTGINSLPSLLHGDLWSGNFIPDELGNVCLIDPAVYYGHREADLAMTKLFGGFDNKFYDAYNEEFPLDDGYNYRENIYKLYHVLNHLNLFGSGYYQQAVSLITYYL